MFVFVRFMVVRSGIWGSNRFRLVAVAVVVVAVLAVAIIWHDFSSGPGPGSSSGSVNGQLSDVAGAVLPARVEC